MTFSQYIFSCFFIECSFVLHEFVRKFGQVWLLFSCTFTLFSGVDNDSVNEEESSKEQEKTIVTEDVSQVAVYVLDLTLLYFQSLLALQLD